NGVETQKPTAQSILKDLVASGLILGDEWGTLGSATQTELAACVDPEDLYTLLLKHNLLTHYQVSRVRVGNLFGLILGNYRVLDRLGSGGMGIVFRAEHIRLRKQVAVKVLHPTHAEHPELLQRFYQEIRAVSCLQHPNVVGALDVGEVTSSGRHSLTLHYFVMEYLPGQDLEQLVKIQAPLPAMQACDIIHQVAAALEEAHKHRLVHRDIKPSNIQITPQGQAKLLDFGLA